MRLLLPLLLGVLCFLQTCSWPAKVHCFHKLACKRPFGFQTEAKTWALVLAKKEKSFLHTEAVPSLSETNNALSICTVPVAIDQPHFLFPRQFFFYASTNHPCRCFQGSSFFMGKTLSVFWHWEEHDPAVLVGCMQWTMALELTLQVACF